MKLQNRPTLLEGTLNIFIEKRKVTLLYFYHYCCRLSTVMVRGTVKVSLYLYFYYQFLNQAANLLLFIISKVLQQESLSLRTLHSKDNTIIIIRDFSLFTSFCSGPNHIEDVLILVSYCEGNYLFTFTPWYLYNINYLFPNRSVIFCRVFQIRFFC